MRDPQPPKLSKDSEDRDRFEDAIQKAASRDFEEQFERLSNHLSRVKGKQTISLP